MAISQLVVTYLSQQRLNQIEVERAFVATQLSLLTATYKQTFGDNLQPLFQQLDRYSQLNNWKLIDHNNKLVREKTKFTSEDNIHRLYIQNPEAPNQLLELTYSFKPVALSSSWLSWQTLLIAAVFCVTVVSLLVGLFRWVFNLEVYSNYLLTGADEANKFDLGKTSNPIHRAFNQLILQNTLLAKDKQELTEQIRKISYVDEVTEIGNQLFFKAEFQVRLHNHEEQESGLLVLLSFGQGSEAAYLALSDEKMKAIASILKHYIHQFNGALVARLRENDFALLLPNHTREQTDQICKSLIKQLSKSVFDTQQQREHFIDIGISVYKHGFKYSKVIAEADMALRNAQLQGGNSWYIYGEPLAESKVRGSLKWRSLLESTLNNQKIQLYIHQMEVYRSGMSDTFEVLARIADGKDMLTADTFLPMANQCGLAKEFDRQIVDKVLAHCLHDTANKRERDFSVNLFVNSLLDDGFYNWLKHRLAGAQGLAQRIIFEIKESQISRHKKELAEIMPELAQLGCRWCVDHFGSPEENINYLEGLPIDSVKIDRRYIFDISENKPQQLMLKTMLINLKSKGIKVFAEGVEKAADADFLKGVDLNGAQGFYYGQPRLMKKLEKYLKAV
ncbi:EAL domain-containing protein [Aliikangiella sp. IMCC44632]